MANCLITGGYELPCKTYMPGLRRVFIGNFFSGGTNSGENVSYTTNATNQITGLTITTGKFYEFDQLKESSDWVEIPHANDKMGTTSYESNITIYLPQISTAARNQMVALASQKLLFIVEDRQGQYFLIGTDGTGTSPSTSQGVDMVDSTSTPGKAFGDANGYTLTFNAVEKTAALEVVSTLISSIVSQ